MPPGRDAPPYALLAYLFRSCIAFYNAKPWKLLGESDKIRVNVGKEPPFFVQVRGADNGAAPGLSLNSAYSQAEELGMAPESIAFSGARLSVVFVPEHEAPQWWRDARRANKWPLASPAAFPTFVATDKAGATRELHHDELRALGVSLSVVALFVATKRKQIESRQPHGDLISVRDDAGAPKVAMVQFPFYPGELEGWQSYKLQHDADSNAHQALQEVRNAALDLPDVSPILNRLVWSFFHDTDPNYLTHEEPRREARLRFLTWAIFAYHTNGATLAERALVRMGETKLREELEVHRRIVKPRVGMFRVLRVEPGVGMQLHDVLGGDTLNVVERKATRTVREGNGVLGMVHPISETDWILSPGLATYPSIPDVAASTEQLPGAGFVPAMEVSLFGASARWIQEVAPDHVEDAYALFAHVITETGDVMPTYVQLQQQIARAEQPSQVARAVVGRMVWWSETEVQVMLAFVMRVWNATPREELGGRSPDAMSAGRGRVRSTPSKWRRGKR